MNALLDSICKAGLNRARIHDALADIEEYDGVTGPMVFDPNQKNVAPMYLGTVQHGAITYRLATMEKQQAGKGTAEASELSDAPATPYARVGEDGVNFVGPRSADLPRGPVRVVLFGPKAAEIARSPEVAKVLNDGVYGGRPWTVLPVESTQNWGAASTQMVHALMDEHAVAIVALDRDASHLSEQLALKCFVPVVALSSDKALTSADIPWIFRLPPGNTAAAALRLLREASGRAGTNPETIRDVLASGTEIDGLAFLPTGEPRER
jgi:hypothetical protein